MQRQQKTLLRLIFMGIMIALGVVISPLLRVEGMCPMAHLINICCAVLLGPADALLCAFLIGIIRMVLMSIPPLALTGAIFGAFLSGLLYRALGGKLVAAFLGEVFGTGVIGALISYPVMTYLWGRGGLTLFFYLPSFFMGTVIGGSLAMLLLVSLQRANVLWKMQEALGTRRPLREVRR